VSCRAVSCRIVSFQHDSKLTLLISAKTSGRIVNPSRCQGHIPSRDLKVSSAHPGYCFVSYLSWTSRDWIYASFRVVIFREHRVTGYTHRSVSNPSWKIESWQDTSRDWILVGSVPFRAVSCGFTKFDLHEECYSTHLTSRDWIFVLVVSYLPWTSYNTQVTFRADIVTFRNLTLFDDI
jgi:hypothetical protein